ncbi:putative ABC transport system permease protein [Lampropedia hyalina DSM 16112]|jgi:putative ABC transport system permease protein|uniref:Putative ABC transport system permease protein n=1 Tax=Lampropedia hyalina DSM 16112 TaxID=1122156 RepID=A0A1M4VUC8_9BURK|nr:ABC transporter permease [Lampropedia hyalina]SHE72433.1 putative ABC transport system permease protein [Lampropedia hyalina DSM 16112]
MKALLRLAWLSAWNRRFTLSLTVFSIALSAFMLLGVERIRTDVRQGFTSAVSGTDLIVGARTGSVQLLLYSVFRVGAATNNIRWQSVQDMAQMRGVAWIIPLSLGDSHRGFPVLGTSADYFTHFRYGERRALELAQGQPFDDLFDAVLGADVARQLGYALGDRIVLAHGSGGVLNVVEHDDKPFVVSGILAPTGTPVDRTVHISLQAMQALHVDWMSGMRLPGQDIDADAVRQMDLQPRNITAALVGLQSRAQVFSVQRQVNNYRSEPLMAVLPGVAMDELWRVIGAGEKSLLLMSILVAFVSLLGMVAVVLAGLNERRRELAVLRAVGARPAHVVALLALEGALTTLVGMVLGTLTLLAALVLLSPWLLNQFGLVVSAWAFTPLQLWLLLGLLVTGLLASLIPGWRAYRLSLVDGLSPPV